MWHWRVYWHRGLAGSHTAEVTDLPKFIAELRAGGHLDGLEIFGGYRE